MNFHVNQAKIGQRKKKKKKEKKKKEEHERDEKKIDTAREIRAYVSTISTRGTKTETSGILMQR